MQGEQKLCSDVDERNIEVNHMNADKENAANQKGQCGSLTDRSGRISKEHGQQIHLLSCFCCGERCRTVIPVSTRCAAAGAAKLVI